ncbi:hypothetical protein BHE90_017440 [Fusarium euwallaceae]|uniref:Uncharacterized protein n=1 Tax=Fusarium euwallaceae TaxID=1147111 RepID=A0A430KXL3_9HYPO|nr:hypothetical protein BHE90_017440 [Fusarium euwallaceae]
MHFQKLSETNNSIAEISRYSSFTSTMGALTGEQRHYGHFLFRSTITMYIDDQQKRIGKIRQEEEVAELGAGYMLLTRCQPTGSSY